MLLSPDDRRATHFAACNSEVHLNFPGAVIGRLCVERQPAARSLRSFRRRKLTNSFMGSWYSDACVYTSEGLFVCL